MLLALFRKDLTKLLWCCEVDRVVKSRVRPHTASKLPSAPVNFAKQLDLQPALTALNIFCRGKRPSQFCNAQKRHRCDQVDKALRYADKGANLTNRLQLAPVDWCYAGKIGVESHSYSGAQHVSNPADTGWVALRHLFFHLLGVLWCRATYCSRCR